MTTPTPDKLERRLKGSNYHLELLVNAKAQEIFEEQFQGDELIDEIQDLMVRWGWLSLDDPDEDIKIECIITDEVWTRIMTSILMKMQATRRRGR